MTSIILIVFLISGIIGIKKRSIGVTCGFILTIFLYFVLNDYNLITFVATVVLGFVASFAGSFAIPWFFSGFKGGKHNTGPSFIGGGSGRGSGGHTGGIIFSDEERKNLKR
jgi:hypothetical protein